MLIYIIFLQMHFQTAKIGFKQFIPPRTQIKVNVITCCAWACQAQTSTSRAVGALCQYMHYINYTNIPDKERRQTSDRRVFFFLFYLFLKVECPQLYA